MKVKLIKIGSILTLINGIYAILLGLFFIFFSKFLISKYFERFPEVWDILVEKWISDISQYFLILVYVGFLLISFGIFIIYLSTFLLKTRDKLAWVILFTSGIIGWAGLFIVNILAKNLMMIILSSIGWISLVIGMTIPLRYYIRKELV
tara:strand:+ start:1441 stop:1887 length:447 start_codon:yes stop_codon:yes gene_type:complete